MGISPIASLTPLPIARAFESDFELLPMERVENSARTHDETYSPSNGKSARGAEDDEPEDETESKAPPTPGDPGRPVSFFA